MDSQELKLAFENLGRDWDEFKQSNDDRLDKIENGKGVAEITEKVDKIDESITALSDAKEAADLAAKALAERTDEIEARFEQGGPQGGDNEKDRVHAEHRKLFDAWFRSGSNDSEEGKALKKFQAEHKDINAGAGATGGFAVPEEIGRDIADQVQLLSPVRDAVRVVTTGTPDYKELVDLHGETSGWAGEAGARLATLTPTFSERKPTVGTLYAYPQATEESVDDVFFNVQQFITDHASQEFARQEGIALLTGDGTNKPTGMLNTAPVTTNDGASPLRSVEALEYLPLNPGVSPPVATINPDALLDIVYTLRVGYRTNASWAMASPTMAIVRKIKQNSEYIWSPGLTMGQQPTLLGFPVRNWEDLAVMDVDSLSILFGDYKRGYLLADRPGTRITVDANITTPGFIKFYVRRREGGIILDNNAIKVGKNSSA